MDNDQRKNPRANSWFSRFLGFFVKIAILIPAEMTPVVAQERALNKLNEVIIKATTTNYSN